MRLAAAFGDTSSRRAPIGTISASQTAPAGTSSATPARGGCRAMVTSRSPPSAAASVSADGPGAAAAAAAASSRAATWVSTTGAGAQGAADLLSHEREVDQGGAPTPDRLGYGHGQRAGLEQGSPQRGVEAGGFGRPHLVGRRRPAQEVGERGDELTLLIAHRQVHERGTLPRLRGMPESLYLVNL